MNFLIITTGGTIFSADNGNGLTPMNCLKTITIPFPCINLMSVDSTNMNPNLWYMIINCIKNNSFRYDGFLVLHGTDTMAFTSSALSLMLRDVEKPVVLTGSSVPLGTPAGDGEENFRFSLSVLEKMARNKDCSVRICFGGKSVSGGRASKKIENGRITFGESDFYGIDREKFLDQHFFTENILPVKLFPGYRAAWLEQYLKLQPVPLGILIESFGTGGLPFIGENIIPFVELCQKKKIPVALSSQVVGQCVDLTVYEVGMKALAAGAVGTLDMTFEMAVVKMMWLLSFCSFDEFKKLYHYSFCGEIAV